MPRLLQLLALLPAAYAAAACSDGNPVLSVEARKLTAGSWGGGNAGMIVDDSVAHVHIGCTFGNFRLPVATDADGDFSVDGEYLLRAYPVAQGPMLPARFTGRIRHGVLRLVVVVDDTVQRRTETLGPVVLTFDRPAQLGPCPICRRVVDSTTPRRQ